MTDLTTELEDQLILIKKCVLNGEADNHPDHEVIAANKDRVRDLRVALRALYYWHGVPVMSLDTRDT